MWRWMIGGVLLAAACTPAKPKPPGDELMGLFDFTVQVVKLPDGTLDPDWEDCTDQSPPITEIPTDDYTFQGTFTRDRQTGQAWLTINDQSREATFDGQYVESQSTAPRQFQAYGSSGVANASLTETLRVALLSRSQSDALGGACPPDALSGGLPLGNGVTPPGETSSGFDALLACGRLVDVVQPGSDCNQCAGCTLRYPVTGVRR